MKKVTRVNRQKTHPLRHLSVRVPWHDRGWDGTICTDPAGNLYCQALTNISETKNADAEMLLAGKHVADLDPKDWPPCIAERASFMSERGFDRIVTHPYSYKFSYLKPTSFRQEPYSAPAIPFRWMSKLTALEGTDSLPALNDEFALDLSEDNEPPEVAFSSWVNGGENQKGLLEYFFSAVVPKQSLCFFYAKQTPLTDDPQRVLLGAALVTKVGPIQKYDQAGEGDAKYLWDRMVQHSMRPSGTGGYVDGVLLPYAKVIELCGSDPTLNPAEFAAVVSEEHYGDYLYVSEHVTNDSAITSLLTISRSLDLIEEKLGIHKFQKEREWLSAQLARLWKIRGPYPGLGSALFAFGITHGVLLSFEIEKMADGKDYWELVESWLEAPATAPKSLGSLVLRELEGHQKIWATLGSERRDLLRVLSRVDVTPLQALRFYEISKRKEAEIDVTDAQIIANPYLLYEKDRYSNDAISFPTIDSGVFPAQEHRHAQWPSAAVMNGEYDLRRVRAVVTYVLESARLEGHTLLPRSKIINRVESLPLQRQCQLRTDTINALAPDLEPQVRTVSMVETGGANELSFQLDYLFRAGEIIRSAVKKRIAGKRFSSDADWREMLDAKLGDLTVGDKKEDEARREKSEALKRIYERRFSVLIGPAGTGKTTVLSVLCAHPSVKAGRVLLLAPTGKARVKMQQRIGMTAQTSAQFLLQYGRFDRDCARYKIDGEVYDGGAKTVIVDEASMMTEEELATLLECVKGADRVILVGDHRQLPPIGAGRPFVDIITELAEEDDTAVAALNITRRQMEGAEDSLAFARIFSNQSQLNVPEVLNDIATRPVRAGLECIRWDDVKSLGEKLQATLIRELGLSGKDDEEGFSLSLGAIKTDKGYINFNCGVSGKSAESWQILTPLRGQLFGTMQINGLLQKKFRAKTIAAAKRLVRYLPKPAGPEGIVYGDKVINIRNRQRYQTVVFGEDPGLLKYVANGEIGMVCGKAGKNSNELWVEFSSQPGGCYVYKGLNENEADLELAYALTVHKAQGSEFGKTFIILPKDCRTMSRELIYTALTRQVDKLIVLHQGEITELEKYTRDYSSETARRMTNLFYAPSLQMVKDNVGGGKPIFLEDRLVHRTLNGEAVRSKSEVIIADALQHSGVRYRYEEQLLGKDGTSRWPDFTIRDAESGRVFYWEHCGMMDNEDYRLRWEKKLEWYRENGVVSVDEGGGAEGGLIVTEEAGKGIDSAQIDRLIKKHLL